MIKTDKNFQRENRKFKNLTHVSVPIGTLWNFVLFTVLTPFDSLQMQRHHQVFTLRLLAQQEKTRERRKKQKKNYIEQEVPR
jgi:hypothetical protein